MTLNYLVLLLLCILSFDSLAMYDDEEERIVVNSQRYDRDLIEQFTQDFLSDFAQLRDDAALIQQIQQSIENSIAAYESAVNTELARQTACRNRTNAQLNTCQQMFDILVGGIGAGCSVVGGSVVVGIGGTGVGLPLSTTAGFAVAVACTKLISQTAAQSVKSACEMGTIEDHIDCMVNG